MSGRRSSGGLKVSSQLPPQLPALPPQSLCMRHLCLSVPPTPTPKSQPLSNTLIPPPKQMMPPGTRRSPSPSQPGQSAWPGSMPRSSGSWRQRDPADLQGLRAPVTAGDSKRRNSGFSESELRPRRRNCVRAEPGGLKRLNGTKGQSLPGLGPGQSTREGQAGEASGALAMCPGPALVEGIQRPWLQRW